jgi:hypothetical protein
MRTTQNRFRKQALIQAGGVAALSALAGAAEAAPIYSGLQNIGLSGNNTVNLDVNGDSVTDITMTAFIYGSNFGINLSQQNGEMGLIDLCRFKTVSIYK